MYGGPPEAEALFAPHVRCLRLRSLDYSNRESLSFGTLMVIHREKHRKYENIQVPDRDSKVTNT